MRLRAVIGDAAFWIPPRLWSYAADNQPDGDFSDYSAEELAMLIGYSSNAQAMLEAMLKAGFMDHGPKIHDWSEHNAYHSGFKARASVAATARWDRVREKKLRKESTGKDKKRKEPSIASSIPDGTPSPTGHCTQSEAEEFCKSIGLPASDGEACFHKWEANGWTNNNKKILNWKSTIRSWKAAGYMASQSQRSSKTPPPPPCPPGYMIDKYGQKLKIA